MTRRRAASGGFSLVEVSVASALLGGVLVVLAGGLHAEFSRSDAIARRGRAESLGRSLVEFYAQLPLIRLEREWRAARRVPEPPSAGRGGSGFAQVDPEVADFVGLGGDFEGEFAVYHPPGALPLRVVETRVSWRALGRTRRVVHRRAVAFRRSEGIGEAAAGAGSGAGGPPVPSSSWGQATSWRPSTRDSARFTPSPSAAPGDREAPGPGGGIRFFGDDADAEAAAAAAGPWSGLPRPSAGAPPGHLPGAASRLAARFVPPGPGEAGGAEVPDGRYRYVAEVVRGPSGAGPLAWALFRLEDPDRRPYELVAKRRLDATLVVGGDEVVAREALRDERGRIWERWRTVGRVFLVGRGSRSEVRALEVRTLPALDESAGGVAMTRRYLAAQSRDLGLRPAETPAADFFEYAAAEVYAAAGARGARRGPARSRVVRLRRPRRAAPGPSSTRASPGPPE